MHAIRDDDLLSKGGNEETANRQDEPHDSEKSTLPWFVRKWLQVIGTLSTSLLGGPRLIKLAHVVNFQKGTTVFLCLGLMSWTRNYSPTATTYTALHGGYGLCWLLKGITFPDPKWESKITIGSAISVFLSVLGPYWVIAYNAIVKKPHRSNLSLCCAVLVYSIGLCLMIGSDCQKYFVLQYKKGLITDGFFSRLRHPNYLGEMMIYGSFAYTSRNASSWAILAWVWIGIFLPSMLQKEDRMSRHEGWPLYKKRAGFLFPRLFPIYTSVKKK